MNRLAELLPFNAGETIASYCSRLAAASGYRHARSFGFDLGFRFQGLAVGTDADVEKFASILGVPRSSLSPGLVMTDDRMNIIAGQKLTRGLAQRQRLRFCPFCIREDERQHGGRRGFRAFGRLSWLVNPIRTCRQHGVRLVTSEITPQPMFIHDFAANLVAERDTVGSLLSSAEPMEADSLQYYVEARMNGGEGSSPWLDTLPLYVAVKVCETVGASERHGIRFRSADIDEREWSACAGAGYNLLREGEDGFRIHLKDQLRHFQDRPGDTGGRSVFGRLYERLAHETSDQAYNPVREIMRDVALNHLPLGPGDDFFGPVTARRLHSVQSASKQFQIHPKRLRKLVINAGLVPAADRTKTAERILVNAEVMERFAVEARRSLDVPEAKAHLGAERVQFELLVKHGFIRTHVGDRSDSDIFVERRFSAGDLDDFLNRLRSSVTREDPGDLCDLRESVKKAGCTFAEIVALIIDRKLSTVAWASDRTGIGAIRVDATEVKRKTIGEDHGCYSLSDLGKLIPASSKIIKALIEGGHLTTVQRRNPIKRNMQTVVEPSALSGFTSEFVSLGNLATARRTRTWNLKRDLEDAGLATAFVAAGMPFYRRSEILEHMVS